jgi:hypothetical protein
MVLALSSTGAWAQARVETFVGVVKAVSGSSVTVERGSITGVFSVDTKTHVGARGATAKTKENQAAGKPGLTVADVIHVGDQVTVKYQEKSNAMIATDIRLSTTLAGK